MATSDKPVILHDIAAGLGLLGRLPVRVDGDRAMRRGARAAWAWPLAGTILGLVPALTGAILMWFGAPEGLAAGGALAAGILVTGALHEDGLADSADGLWGGQDRARRLEIMKDSRIGTYGVVALILSLLLRWSALAALFSAGLVWGPVLAAAALSRAMMAGVMAALPNARGAGLSASVGRPSAATALAALALAVLLGLLATGWTTLAALAAALAAALWMALVARGRIGGQTGDILGATQQVAEIAALGVFAMLST